MSNGPSLFRTTGNGRPGTRDRLQGVADKVVEVLGEAGVPWTTITLHLTDEGVIVDSRGDEKKFVEALKDAGFSTRQHNLNPSKTICKHNGVEVTYRNTSSKVV